MQKVDQALRLDPRQVEALMLKADLLRAQGDNDQALEQLDKAVAVLPDAERVRLARARALLAAGEDTRARDDIKVALKFDPRGTLANFLLAVLDIRARDWKAASASLEHVQPVLSQLPRGEYYFALVKSNTNELEQAAEFADHYVSRVPTDPDGFRLVADIDLKLANHAAGDRAGQLRQAAATALRKATDMGFRPTAAAAAEPQLKSDSTSDAQADTPEALTRLAALQLGAGDSAAASHDLDQSLESVPKRLDAGATRVIAALSVGDIARAEAALERFRRQQDADPAMVGNLTGLVRMARLDYDGARAAWQDAARAAPDSPALHINLARVLALQGQGAEAEKLLDEVLARDPANRQALLALVDLQLAQGRLKDAIAAVQAARKAAPLLTSLLITEAALRARSGDFAGAYGVLDEVPLEEAHSPALLTARGQIMLAQGRAKEAVDVYRQILLANQADFAARQRLIQLLVGLGRLPEALTLAQDGLARQPSNSALLQTKAALILRMPPPDGGLDKALAMADAAEHDPINLPAARLLKGEIYMAAKRYADAAAAFDAEMKEAPFSALVVADAGALRAAGHADQATAKLRDWIAKQPDPTVAQALAVNDIEAHQFDEARTSLESVLAARPSDPVALNNLAWVYQQQNDPRARELAEKAYLLSPSPQAADTLGWIITQQGGADAAKGLLLLRRAAALLPRDPTVQYHFAAALQANGLRGEAVTVLGTLLATPVSFDERPQAVLLQQKLGIK
jgi:putative PEP-CTERM system TPR-repeat lipoprotein